MVKNISCNILENKDICIICHQVDLKVQMNTGISLDILKAHPKVYNECSSLAYKNDNSEILLGNVLMTNISDNRIVASMFSQYGFYTEYTSFRHCLNKIKKYAEENNLTVGFPKFIGCCMGSGSWDIIEKLIKDIFEDSCINCYIVSPCNS